MKSFRQMITEADYKRFIKKNPNLSRDQINQINAFFQNNKDKAKEFEKKYGWQSKTPKEMSWADFNEIIGVESNSTKKKKAQKLRHKGISGQKEGEDYINVKIKNPYFLVYIPLTPQSSQVLGSVHIGDCHHKGCIANSQARRYYKSEAVKQNKVPVMVIGNGTKYFVMISTNGAWEVWDADNERAKRGEAIPNFNIKKELANKKMLGLYKEVIDTIWNKPQVAPKGIDKQEFKAAVQDYENMAEKIDDYFGQIAQNEEDYDRELKEVYENTIENYEEKIQEIESEIDTNELAISRIKGDEANKARANIIKRIDSIKAAVRANPLGTDPDSLDDPVWFINGYEYTKEEIDRLLKSAKKDFTSEDYDNDAVVELEDDIANQREEIEDLQNDLNELKAVEYYEIDSDVRPTELEDIEWWSEPPSRDYIHEGTYPPRIEPLDYDDYFDFIAKYMDYDINDFNESELIGSIYDLQYEGGNNSGEDVLESADLPHPSEAKKRR